MILIDRPELITSYQDALIEFKKLYLSAFPDEDEREDFEEILKRITLKKPLRSVIVLRFLKEQIAGGMIIDIYNNQFFHLIYIVVNPDLRNLGIAKSLITNDLFNIANTINSEVKGVFLETNIPWKTTKDSFNPKIRLQIFKGLGIKWIPIDYAQPALSVDKKVVRNLFLLYYPFSKKDISLEKNDILEFLSLFYHGLGIIAEQSKDFLNMKNVLISLEHNRDSIMLKEIPTIENVEFKFNHAAICIQLSNENSNKSNTGLCEFFHSYETDLLSYHFQRDRPFVSRYQRELENLKIHIHFPEYYSYHSEGRTAIFANHRQMVTARLKVSSTEFQYSDNIVWSIVILNDENDYFTELEIIKLSCFFAGNQERTNIKEEIQFSVNGENPQNFETFIKAVLKLSESEIRIGTGIIQFDTSKIEKFDSNLEVDWRTFYSDLSASIANGNENLSRLNEKYNSNETYYNLLNLMCGLVLGIFDFKRMGFDEVVDTLNMIKGNQSYLLFVNRGIMLNLCHEDEMFESVINDIGISPYLIIPNSVLNNNTYFLEKTMKKLENIDVNDSSSSKLNSEKKFAEKVLYKSTINNVFHYKTEKRIYELCSNERNHQLIINNINANLDEINQIIEERKTKREAQSDLFMTLLLTVLSCLQFQGIFQSIANNDFIMSWIYTLTFSITITAMIYSLLRMKK